MKATAAYRIGTITFALSFLLAAQSRADNWPQWRGPNNDGVCKEKGLPAEWSESKNIAWKLPMPGMGSSTPAVWGEKIFFASEDGNYLVAMCVSTQGKELWKQKVGASKRYRSRVDEGNHASPSPSTDGKHVWVFFGTGDLACYDFDGNQVWHFNGQERYGKFSTQHGFHTTPVLYEDRLYVQWLHSGGQCVIAFDKLTGNEIWKVQRKSDGYAENEHSYASPSVWHDGKEAYLVTHGNDYTVAFRLSDGAEILRLGELNPKSHYNPALRFVASPLVTQDLIVVPTAKGGPVVAVKPDAKGLVGPGSEFEQWRKPSNTPDVPCPLAYDGLVYLCRETGVLICLDAKTGKEYYTEKTHSQRHRASPVYADGKVYLSARDGTITVVKAGPKFESLATNKLPITLTASPAISNGRIYIRGFETLYAISEGGK
ncbi:MAG TPA: PQQ-binding-like beta-propeller repeat protein [Gemmataceae bacterium]|nr:PQQ-binding-like beta-propeller repeat protein [Gemmataceae bacterium]